MKFKIFLNAVVLLSLCVCFSFFFSACVKTNLPPITPTSSSTISGLIAGSSNLTVLDSILKRTQLDTVFSGTKAYTFFSATDAAFATVGFSSTVLYNLPDSQLRKLILYSAIPQALYAAQFPAGPDAKMITASGDSIFVTNTGSQIFINGIQVVSYDIVASNGIMDAVATPLIPPSGNMLQTIQPDTAFSFFIAAANKTTTTGVNVDSILTGNNIHTLFLPINDAFRAAGYSTIDNINNANPDSLSRILQYNILPGRLFTSDFTNNQTEATVLTGSNVTIGFIGTTSYGVLGNKNSGPSVIISSNIMATNGVIHVIQQLLLP